MSWNRIPFLVALACFAAYFVALLIGDRQFRRFCWELACATIIPLVIGVSVSLVLALGWLMTQDGGLLP